MALCECVTRMRWALAALAALVAASVVLPAWWWWRPDGRELLALGLGAGAMSWLGSRLLLCRFDASLRRHFQQQMTAPLSAAPTMMPPPPLQDRVERLMLRGARLAAVADSCWGLQALFDEAGRLEWVGRSVLQLTGHSREECMAAADDLAELLVFEPDRAYFHLSLEKVLAAGSEARIDDELRLLHKDGSTVWVACHWRVFALEESEHGVGVRLSAENIQARKEAEYRLLETVAELRRTQALSEHYLERSRDERERLLALFDVMRQGILFMGPDARVQYFNAAFLRLWDYPNEENLLGVRDVVWQSHLAGRVEQPSRLLDHLAQPPAPPGSAPFEIVCKDGRIVTEISSLVGGGDGRPSIGRMWIWEDVTEPRRIARQLVEMAERDALTQLYNRRRFEEELERMLADANRRGVEVGLVMIDLDGFKPVNDSFGHAAGDEVLVTMARRVAEVVRRHELFFRLGGDEFAILMPNARREDLQELANRVVACVGSLAFRFDGHVAHVTASLGLALFPLHARDADGLSKAADDALYASKEAGRNRWTLAQSCAGGLVTPGA